MKLKGTVLQAPPNVEFTVYRGDVKHVFVCKAVLDYTRFDEMCPQPKPPVRTARTKNGPIKEVLFDDAGYLARMSEHTDRRTDWMILESLSATEGLEWDTVDLKDPSTWGNFRKDLATCLTQPEITQLVNSVLTANMPDGEEAQKNFT